MKNKKRDKKLIIEASKYLPRKELIYLCILEGLGTPEYFNNIKGIPYKFETEDSKEYKISEKKDIKLELDLSYYE